MRNREFRAKLKSDRMVAKLHSDKILLVESLLKGVFWKRLFVGILNLVALRNKRDF